MNPKLLIFILFVLARQIQYSDIQCKCEQILTGNDCSQADCLWESNKCTKKSESKVKVIDNTYCLPLNKISCLENLACEWNSEENICTHFTTCSVSCDNAKRCKKIQDQCFEMSECSYYQNQESCLINETCYWDSKCIIATKCDQFRFTNDQECRKAMQICTVNKNLNGCQEAQECSEYQIQDQCIYNRLQDQNCYWNGTKCFDKICINAPNTFKSEKDCSNFSSTCTTTGAGCILKTVCSAVKVKEACSSDINGNSCFWNDETDYCFEKNQCSYAPLNIKSNQQCKEFLAFCITTQEGGCVNNLSCSSANIEIACQQDMNGNICFWKDGICLQKTCENAPSSILLNEDCEQFLPNKNCITKLGGGCITYTTCNEIKIQIACITNALGINCFWDQNTCKEKKCDQYMQTSHEECQKFLNTCTVNSEKNHCIDWVCENSLDQLICQQKSHPQKLCNWSDSYCIKKECSLAPLTYQSHQECQNYLSSCTLNNRGYGCTIIPLKCEAITIEAGCVNECGWNGQFCIDKSCETAPKNYQTTVQCNQYLQGCVSVNPNTDGIIIGCMIIPILCEDRKTIDNCITYNNDCFWNSVQGKCISINCNTAILEGTPGQIKNINAESCNDFQQLGCLLSNDGTNCIEKVKDCNQLLTSDNCKDESKINGSCFWNSQQLKCYDKICKNINYTTHDNCNSTLNICTVNKLSNSCMELANDCSSYVTQDQCKITIKNINCIWTGNSCRNIQCDDAPKTDQYDSDLECQNFKINNDQNCTVISYVGKGCESKKQHCEDYLSFVQCNKTLDNQNCIWNNNKCFNLINFSCENIILNQGQTCEQVLYSCFNDGSNICKTKTCDQYTTIDGKSTGTSPITTELQCQFLDPTCTITNNNTCQTKAMICSNYNTQVNCTKSIYSDCIWINGNNTCVQKGSLCYLFTGSSQTCLSYNQFCTSNGSSESDPCISKQCSDFNGFIGTYTYADCQSINNSCSVNLDGSSCIQGQSSCSGYYNQNECVYASSLKCIWDGTQCFSLNYQTSCTIISQYTSVQLNNDICQSYFPKCRANKTGTNCIDMQDFCENYQDINNCSISFSGYCIIDQNYKCKTITLTTQCSELILQNGTSYTHELCNQLISNCTGNGLKCIDITCDNKQNATSFEDCQNWLIECTYIGDQKCKKMQQYCYQQTIESCYRTQEGECIIINNKCIKKTCEQAEPIQYYWNDIQCTTYMSTCTVVQPGGCQLRSNCNSYKSEKQCKYDIKNGKCFWNPTLKTCVDLNCLNIEQTDKFDSHDECVAVDSTLQCTIRESGLGCADRRDCNQYTLQEQCHINSYDKKCIWNINLQNPICEDKSCHNAPFTINNENDCKLFDINCTVGAIYNGQYTILQGCQLIGDCQNYIAKEQCKINQQGNKCIWIEDDLKCVDKNCQNAPLNYSNDESCRNYLPNCTVQESLQGCMDILLKCEQFKIKEQCNTDLQGNLCYWTNDYTCITRSCDNAPNNINDETGCNQYLNGCTFSPNKCKVTICEDYIFKTDKACKAKIKTCTTDGNKCVLRGTCVQALSRYGCITQIDGQQCEWIEQDGKQYCTLKQCQTAPIYFVTESQCQGYFHNCIPKLDGGCIKKSTCQAVNIKQGCTTDIDGNKCIWDNKSCRTPICSDYKGLNHYICNKQGQDCTIGLNGKCQQIQLCQQTLIKEACIIGIDGPCLWIDGACYQYNSCQSIKWNTHEQCQKISNKCTTDGTQCIGITSCEKTNINGGCVKGIDGDCYEEIINGIKQCTKFKCSYFNYQTHDECYKINKKCTTDGISCIDLKICSSYDSLQSCIIDKDNKQCQWKNNKCNLQSLNYCIDYLLEQTCQIGKDGQCNWYQDYCGIDCSNCSNKCVKNGAGCIPQNNCTNYKNIQTCNQNGLDGICKWNQTCNLMTQCNDANGQFDLCIRNNDKCYWNGKDQKNICTELNCQQNYQITGLCTIILRLNSSIPLICQQTNNECIEVKPENIQQDNCFTISKYTFTWNSNNRKCQKCGLQDVSNQNETTQGNNTVSGLKLILSIMILLII